MARPARPLKAPRRARPHPHTSWLARDTSSGCGYCPVRTRSRRVPSQRRRGDGSHREPSKDPDVLTVDGDISEQATADQIISQAIDRFGHVDTLVNNASVFVSKPFIDYTAEDYALVTGVNLAGFFWLTQRAIGQMLKQRSGHVVNISASVADRADSVEPTALAALTKGGLAAVTRSLAVEYR